MCLLDSSSSTLVGAGDIDLAADVGNDNMVDILGYDEDDFPGVDDGYVP